MAIPSTPQTFYLQTANGQNFLSWDVSLAATSYKVQRSTDSVTYSDLATPSLNSYLDTSVTIGVQYWYQVAAVNGSGVSPYTNPQSCVPVPAGEECLGSIRLQAQQRADRVNSEFVTLPEWNKYINQSLFELYDLLVAQYGEPYFLAPALSFTTNGAQNFYDLPNGVNYSGAKPFYKLLGVDLQAQNSNNGYVTVPKFNFVDRNKYFYPNSASTLYGMFNTSYRVMGNQIEFIPIPSANQVMRLWYIPRMDMLLKDTDVTNSGVSGWIEYVITDAAIKALQKEESDVSVLAAQKLMLIERIKGMAPNRDAGAPDTVSDTRSSSWGGGPFGSSGMGRAGW